MIFNDSQNETSLISSKSIKICVKFDMNAKVLLTL